MANRLDPLEVAMKIAGIASKTKDLDTGLELIDLADQLLNAAGLPPAPTHHRSDSSSC